MSRVGLCCVLVPFIIEGWSELYVSSLDCR